MQSSDWKLTNSVYDLVKCEDKWDKGEKAIRVAIFVLFASFVLQFPLMKAYRYVSFEIPIILSIASFILVWTPLCSVVRVLVYILSIVTAVLDIIIFAVTDPTIRLGIISVVIIGGLIYSVA